MILLTGAAGFIGSRILKALNATGRDDILCVDDLTDGRKMKNLVGRHFRYYCDYRDLGAAVKTQNQPISAIIHQGANSSTAEQNGRSITLTNYSFSVDMFDLAKTLNCPLIYASSAAVYQPFMQPTDTLILDIELEQPRSPYAISKWMFDDYVRRTPHTNRCVGLRYFNVYGPNEEHKDGMSSVARQVLIAMKNQRNPTLFEGSENIFRDFVYVDDVVQVVLWALHAGTSGIYDVGTGVPRSFYVLVDTARTVTQQSCEIEYVPFPEKLKSQYQHCTRANLRPLRRVGYMGNFRPLSEGLRAYWEEIQRER
jgi:ADP-L-glycero-D-manno-heptose 6-epimerase